MQYHSDLDINTESLDINTEHICNQDIYNNPWLAKSNIKTIINQNIINDITTLSNKQLIQHFRTLYIISLNNNDFDDCITKNKLTVEEYNKIKNNLTIKEVSFELLKNKLLIDFLTIVHRADLPSSCVNKNGQIQYFENEILVISMLNISSNALDCFIKQYNGVTSFSDIIQCLLINDYLQKNIFYEHNKIIKYQMINNIVEANYWTVSSNCKLNITYQFVSRGFNLALNQKLDDNSVKDIIKKISHTDNNNYLSDIFKKQLYVDASSNIDSNGYKKYRINRKNPDIVITRDEFNHILDICMNKKELYLI
jgi:hypothetical protein